MEIINNRFLHDSKKKINKKRLLFKRIDNKPSEYISVLLLVYIYKYYFLELISLYIKIPFWVNYILELLIITSVLLLIGDTKKINRNYLMFMTCFFIVGSINCCWVSYKQYAMSDFIPSIIEFTIPSICILNEKFDINDFINKWFSWALCNIVIVFMYLYLYKKDFVDYSSITSVTLSNILILSYAVFIGKSTLLLWFNLIVEVMLICLLGGRSQALGSVVIFAIALVFNKRLTITQIKKRIAAILLILIFVALNLLEIMVFLNNILVKIGYNSRTLFLIIEDLSRGTLYITKRNIIYELCIQYVKARKGLPGGFGIPRYISGGEFYHTHNIILQVIVQFGIYGGIVAVFAFIKKLGKTLKKSSDTIVRLIVLITVNEFVVGMFNGNFWQDYGSVFLIAIVFFADDSIKMKKIEME